MNIARGEGKNDMKCDNVNEVHMKRIKIPPGKALELVEHLLDIAMQKSNQISWRKVPIIYCCRIEK